MEDAGLDPHGDAFGAAEQAQAAIGFGRDRREGEDTEAVERMFTPEFRNRLDAVISFAPLGKEVILLSYPDEPHHLRLEENQKDFQIRMKQYFDHYLKGAEAPSWLSEGVPFLDKGRDVVVW